MIRSIQFLPLNILSLAFFLILTSCAVVQKKTPPPSSNQTQSEFSRAEQELQNGQTKLAMSRLKKITSQVTANDMNDDAYLMLGHIYYKQNEFNEAYTAYLSVTNSEFASPRENEALFGAARALYKLGRYDEALSLSNRVRISALSAEHKSDFGVLKYNILYQLGDRLEALKTLIALTESTTELDKKERYRIKALEYVESILKENELQAVASQSSYGFVRGHALYKVGLMYFEQRDYSRAESYFSDVINLMPDTDFAQSARNYIDQIAARRRVSPFTIGAVLPLSGRHANIAQKTLRGLQMGLGIQGQRPSDFKLAVIDSESNPDVARRAVERLVIEDGAIAIVGDLLSKTAEPVALKADELGVPVIGLSQKSGLTQIGENVFRNALTSAALVRELVKNAIEVQGMKRFAILYPNDPYGVEYANLFWDQVLLMGGQITAAQTYAPTEKDFSSAISRLVGTYYLEDRADEYTNLVKDWYSQQKTITARVVPPSDLLPPIIDFDGIFIPDGVKSLGQIASMLVYNDIKGVRLLGTNLWNSSNLIERGTHLIDHALFVDAKSSIDRAFETSQFYRDYKSLYSEEPSSFEAQAYDTGLALRNAIESGARSRISLRDALLSLRAFQGTVGSVSVNEEREFTRPLVVLTVKAGRIEESQEKYDPHAQEADQSRHKKSR
jgi:branched-chain amino acid transport system substrate-binding protein